MEGFAIFLGLCFVLSICAICYLGVDNSELKLELRKEESKYNQLVHTFYKKDRDWVHMVNEYKKVKHECDLLKQGVKTYSQAVNVKQFTQEDLKRMKHQLHPDKHGGKTNDLFIKVNESLKQE